MEKTLDEAYKEIRKLERAVEKLTDQVENLARIVNALAPVVTDLLAGNARTEHGDQVFITTHDEGGGDWLSR